MQYWRTAIRSPYAAVLLVGAFAAWVVLSHLPQPDPMATTKASVTDSKKLNPPDLKRAADLIVDMTNEFREHHSIEHVKVNIRTVACGRLLRRLHGHNRQVLAHGRWQDAFPAGRGAWL